MNGWAQISTQSCVGVSSCSGLSRATILEESCVGVGACSRSLPIYDSNTNITEFPTSFPTRYESVPDSTWKVGPGSCSGCYACSNSTSESTVAIGSDSCLGFSVCEELSGNVTIGDESCYGLKACSNSSDYSSIMIDSQSCVGARSCMSMSGNSAVSNSSCVDPQACRYMNNGTVNSWSCQGFSSCKNAREYHNITSTSPLEA
eukprot:scaffold37420_cov44-Cyclotella_meneghiniana.AAC.2